MGEGFNLVSSQTLGLAKETPPIIFEFAVYQPGGLTSRGMLKPLARCFLSVGSKLNRPKRLLEPFQCTFMWRDWIIFVLKDSFFGVMSPFPSSLSGAELCGTKVESQSSSKSHCVFQCILDRFVSKPLVSSRKSE